MHIFFALSGFLITKLLVEKYFLAQSFWRGLTAFWVARVFRILPLAYFAVVVVAYVLDHPASSRFLLIQSDVHIKHLHIATGDWLPHTGHFWSLAVEMRHFSILYLFGSFVLGCFFRSR
ncbi:hypothetical protein BZM27_52660 [Paraburkholderia steynii]|uniref:Acyltransferase 3 domain-containing protein n=1 Tax=Paraburkholderia steynii TaxID=1245441 RepID=A0A4R0WYU2_9BURK|nr:hypothetical protein BZM27_52660 [Paraburkholderia steynii]